MHSQHWADVTPAAVLDRLHKSVCDILHAKPRLQHLVAVDDLASKLWWGANEVMDNGDAWPQLEALGMVMHGMGLGVADDKGCRDRISG